MTRGDFQDFSRKIHYEQQLACQNRQANEAMEIRLFGQSGSPDHYGKADAGATLELLSASEDGGFLSLSGKVSAQVGPSDDRGRTIDLSAARKLELNFSGVIGSLDN